jgi:hypothetical protein
VPAAVYVVALAGVGLLLRTRVPGRAVRATALATGVTLVVFSSAVALFEAGALYYRHAPPGSGAQRHGEALDRFYHWSELVFFSLYGVVLALGVVVGLVAGRRLFGRGLQVAVATGVAVGGFLVLTLPVVEFANACNVGRALVTDRYVEC